MKLLVFHHRLMQVSCICMSMINFVYFRRVYVYVYITCMYVCMYVCCDVMYFVCMYVCMNVCMYVCLYVCIYLYMSVCMYVFADVCMLLSVCICRCMWYMLINVSMLMSICSTCMSYLIVFINAWNYIFMRVCITLHTFKCSSVIYAHRFVTLYHQIFEISVSNIAIH